jgi:hypothetical protein
VPPSPDLVLDLEPVATYRARRHVDELVTAFRTGAWNPSPLEAHVAQRLLASTADDGMLTSRRVRAALREGRTAMRCGNNGLFARVLGELLLVLDDPQLVALDVVDAAGELVGAVASTARGGAVLRDFSA